MMMNLFGELIENSSEAKLQEFIGKKKKEKEKVECLAPMFNLSLGKAAMGYSYT